MTLGPTQGGSQRARTLMGGTQKNFSQRKKKKCRQAMQGEKITPELLKKKRRWKLLKERETHNLGS